MTAMLHDLVGDRRRPRSAPPIGGTANGRRAEPAPIAASCRRRRPARPDRADPLAAAPRRRAAHRSPRSPAMRGPRRCRCCQAGRRRRCRGRRRGDGAGRRPRPPPRPLRPAADRSSTTSPPRCRARLAHAVGRGAAAERWPTRTRASPTAADQRGRRHRSRGIARSRGRGAGRGARPGRAALDDELVEAASGEGEVALVAQLIARRAGINQPAVWDHLVNAGEGGLALLARMAGFGRGRRRPADRRPRIDLWQAGRSKKKSPGSTRSATTKSTAALGLAIAAAIIAPPRRARRAAWPARPAMASRHRAGRPRRPAGRGRCDAGRACSSRPARRSATSWPCRSSRRLRGWRASSAFGVARPAVVAARDHDLDLWVRAEPEGDDVVADHRKLAPPPAAGPAARAGRARRGRAAARPRANGRPMPNCASPICRPTSRTCSAPASARRSASR